MADPSTPNAIGTDILLDRYRQLIANSLLKLYDSCKVHDFLQNIRRNMENDNGEWRRIAPKTQLESQLMNDLS